VTAPEQVEFVPRPRAGRQFTERYKVRLGDAGPDGRLRLDAVARMLQDVATDDAEDTELDDGCTWVARRTAIRRVGDARWPRYSEEVTLVTWCGGVGAAWAERRTDLVVGTSTVLEAAVLWVPVDARGRPMRISPRFVELYEAASGGRRVAGRVARSVPPEGAAAEPWQVRRSDFDVVGHVNNAVAWEAVVEVLDAPVRAASVVHHGSIDPGDEVQLVRGSGRLWLVVDREVRVSAEYTTR
jgi:acyl-ACP thioesterase